MIMSLVNDVSIEIKYYPPTYIAEDHQPDLSQMWDQLHEHELQCMSGRINVGILPWKLIMLDYHAVYPDRAFLDEVQPIIDEVIDLINVCTAEENKYKWYNIYMNYVREKTGIDF